MPLFGATATSTNEALPCNGRDCLPPRNLHVKKNDRCSITDLGFSLWSRLQSYDPISLKHLARFSQSSAELKKAKLDGMDEDAVAEETEYDEHCHEKTGEALNCKLVEDARNEELMCMRQIKLHDDATVSEWRKPPIDTNGGRCEQWDVPQTLGEELARGSRPLLFRPKPIRTISGVFAMN